MGWDFCDNWKTKKDLIQEILLNSPNCLAYRIEGTVVWSVWCSAENKEDKYIRCDLVEYDRRMKCYGHKTMDESMAPFYYSCPLKFLDMAPVANEKWREEVRNWHAVRKVTNRRSSKWLGN